MIQCVGCLLCTCVWQPRAFLYVSRLGCVVWIGVLVFYWTHKYILTTSYYQLQ